MFSLTKRKKVEPRCSERLYGHRPMVIGEGELENAKKRIDKSKSELLAELSDKDPKKQALEKFDTAALVEYMGPERFCEIVRNCKTYGSVGFKSNKFGSRRCKTYLDLFENLPELNAVPAVGGRKRRTRGKRRLGSRTRHRRPRARRSKSRKHKRKFRR